MELATAATGAPRGFALAAAPRPQRKSRHDGRWNAARAWVQGEGRGNATSPSALAACSRNIFPFPKGFPQLAPRSTLFHSRSIASGRATPHRFPRIAVLAAALPLLAPPHASAAHTFPVLSSGSASLEFIDPVSMFALAEALDGLPATDVLASSDAPEWIPLAAGAGVVLALAAAARAAAYFRLQYMLASVLTRYVPRGGAKVLDLNLGSGRHLYYLPNDVSSVVGLFPSLDPGIIRTQAIQNGIDLSIRETSSTGPENADKAKKPDGKQLLQTLQALPSSSYDAAISMGGVFSAVARSEAALFPAILKEITRVLKPARPLVFFEKVPGDIVEGSSPVFFMSEGDADLFSQINWDYLLPWLDKHVMGVATTEPAAMTQSKKPKK